MSRNPEKPVVGSRGAAGSDRPARIPNPPPPIPRQAFETRQGDRRSDAASGGNSSADDSETRSGIDRAAQTLDRPRRDQHDQ